MKLDHDRFLEDGFLILRGFIPPDRLHELRLGFDILVQKSQEQSRRERKADEPPGGAWQAGGQPRVKVDDVVDADTAHVLDYYIGAPMEVSSELLPSGNVSNTLMELMCSAVWDYGATDWHRDYCSNTLAPLAGVQGDLIANGVPYVQWNAALYDDDLFWVVPGSHRTPDSDDVKKQLMLDCRNGMPGAFQAQLRAGDAIVYSSYMLHQGSPYTSRMRRVIHMGYCDLDMISSFVLHPHWNLDLKFTRHLSPASRARFEEMAKRTKEARDRYEAILRAALDGNAELFRAQLAAMHPGASHRITAVAHLCRLADKIGSICGSQSAQLTPVQFAAAEGGYGEEFWNDFKRRFPPLDADALSERFASFTAAMRRDRDSAERFFTDWYRQLAPAAEEALNFDTRALRTHFTQMPEGYDVENFIRGWEGTG